MNNRILQAYRGDLYPRSVEAGLGVLTQAFDPLQPFREVPPQNQLLERLNDPLQDTHEFFKGRLPLTSNNGSVLRYQYTPDFLEETVQLHPLDPRNPAVSLSAKKSLECGVRFRMEWRDQFVHYRSPQMNSYREARFDASGNAIMFGFRIYFAEEPFKEIFHEMELNKCHKKDLPLVFMTLLKALYPDGETTIDESRNALKVQSLHPRSGKPIGRMTLEKTDADPTSLHIELTNVHPERFEQTTYKWMTRLQRIMQEFDSRK